MLDFADEKVPNDEGEEGESAVTTRIDWAGVDNSWSFESLFSSFVAVVLISLIVDMLARSLEVLI
jgi:hypothetical protein